MTQGYIYLIQTREYLGTNVYKVGRTSQSGDSRKLTRLTTGYPPESQQKYIESVDDVMNAEKAIKKRFKIKFKLVCGSEWFDGDCDEMKEIIREVISENKTQHLTLSDDPYCPSCDGTGIGYLSDGIYGNCPLCVFYLREEDISNSEDTIESVIKEDYCVTRHMNDYIFLELTKITRLYCSTNTLIELDIENNLKNPLLEGTKLDNLFDTKILRGIHKKEDFDWERDCDKESVNKIYPKPIHVGNGEYTFFSSKKVPYYPYSKECVEKIVKIGGKMIDNSMECIVKHFSVTNNRSDYIFLYDFVKIYESQKYKQKILQIEEIFPFILYYMSNYTLNFDNFGPIKKICEDSTGFDNDYERYIVRGITYGHWTMSKLHSSLIKDETHLKTLLSSFYQKYKVNVDKSGTYKDRIKVEGRSSITKEDITNINECIELLSEYYIESTCYSTGSYGLKHVLEKLFKNITKKHRYVSNGEAILACFVLGIKQSIYENNTEISVFPDPDKQKLLYYNIM